MVPIPLLEPSRKSSMKEGPPEDPEEPMELPNMEPELLVNSLPFNMEIKDTPTEMTSLPLERI